MPVGAIRRCTPASISAAWPGLAAISRAARSAMPSRPRNSAWVIGPSAARPAARALPAKAGKQHVGRQVGGAGLGQRIDVGVPAHRLQRIAERRPSAGP